METLSSQLEAALGKPIKAPKGQGERGKLPVNPEEIAQFAGSPEKAVEEDPSN